MKVMWYSLQSKCSTNIIWGSLWLKYLRKYFPNHTEVCKPLFLLHWTHKIHKWWQQNLITTRFFPFFFSANTTESYFLSTWSYLGLWFSSQTIIPEGDREISSTWTIWHETDSFSSISPNLSFKLTLPLCLLWRLLNLQVFSSNFYTCARHII
jgi:hypothetical protein